MQYPKPDLGSFPYACLFSPSCGFTLPSIPVQYVADGAMSRSELADYAESTDAVN